MAIVVTNNFLDAGCATASIDKKLLRTWCAVYVHSRSEYAVERYMASRGIKIFVPTIVTTHVWASGERKNIRTPLFSMYVFAFANYDERLTVLQNSRVLHVVGGRRDPVQVTDSEIRFLRSDLCMREIHKYVERPSGEQAKLLYMTATDVEGVLIRNSNTLQFAVNIPSVGEYVAVQVSEQEVSCAGAMV
ncbi:MAG: transcription termination/antitermination NusG family protein [Terracidiphilus sp.]|nr:transcription termination/antitermination NusG family protein [Terracidiphilus sp.]